MILHRTSNAGAPHTSQRRSASPFTAVCGADLARSIPRAHRTIEAKKSHLLARGGSEILEDHHGRVPTGGSGDAPSGMRAAPAEVQSGDRGPIRRPTGERPEGEELVRGHVDLIDASAGQTPFPFHVEGRENLSPLNRMSGIRSERGGGLEERVADILLPIVPGPCPQAVRRASRGSCRRPPPSARPRTRSATGTASIVSTPTASSCPEAQTLDRSRSGGRSPGTAPATALPISRRPTPSPSSRWTDRRRCNRDDGAGPSSPAGM